MKNIKILINCHKQTERLHDDIFTPILAGAAFADEGLKAAFRDDLHDDMGENIARLHPYSAELTAIYWAWKNYDRLGDPDWIGLFHYRRFFNFSDRLAETDNWKRAFFDFDEGTCCRFGWDREHIEAMCEDADLILPDPELILDPCDWKTPCSLETHYKHSHLPESLDAAAEMVRRVHPDYAQTLEATLRSGSGHFCNMFLMTRELFFDYAQWLFSVLLPLAEKLPVTDPKYDDPAQKRVLGFLGERLFNVWINKQVADGVRLKEIQRLTGYLTEADKAHFQKTYGFEAFSRAYAESKRFVSERSNVFDRGEDDNVICHPIRRKERPLVSVLLPVYNVGAFLRECCESLIHQTLEDIEFVFVNDAATDNSPEILREYYEKDDRVVLVEHKQNRGMSCARNTAFRFMRGKYFSCIDSDDVCDVTMFEKLSSKAEALGADIVTCSVFGFYESVKEVYYHRPLEWFGDSDRLLSLRDRPQQLMEPAAWCKLFRTDYVRGLDYFEFREGTRSWEDVPAMTSAFCQTERIATVQEALYFYRQRREGNQSSNMTRRNTDEYISGAILQQAILDRHNCHDELLQSYIEEFKFLYAEWSLTKMRKKDIPYFFRRVPSLFRKEDKHYLQRVFDLYPHRKRFYQVLMTRSAALYYVARFGYHTLARGLGGVKKLLRGVKRGVKRLFNIRREDVYWTFGYGALSVRLFKKSYYRQTIAWYQARVGDRDALEGSCRQLRGSVSQLENRLEEQRREGALALERAGEERLALEEARERLDRRLEELEEDLRDLRRDKRVLEAEKAALTAEKSALTAEIAAAERERDRLLESSRALEQNNLALSETNAETRRLCETLNDTLQLLEGDKRALGEEKAALQTTLDRQREELNGCWDTIGKFKQEFDGFYHAVWATAWIASWKQYYYENYPQIDEKLALVTAGMDEESRETVLRHCRRNFELLPTEENTALYRYDHYKLYTPWELEGAKTMDELERFRGDWVIPEKAMMENSVWRFHCGLKTLPQHVLDRLRGRGVIDGGAFWGDSALVFSTYGPSVIFAFEPQPDTHEMLRGVVRDNGLEGRIVPVRAGLGADAGTARLYTSGTPSGANTLGMGDDPQIDEIEIMSIDGFLRDREERIGLIKLDVEGKEYDTICGAMETIRRDRPVLLISIYHTPRDFFDIKPMLEAENLGYHFLVRKFSFNDLVTEVMLLGYPEEEEK